MVALVESVANVGRDYMSGFKRGSEFQTEAPSDIAAYGAEIEEMSEVGSLLHLAGVCVGEIVNFASLGYFERKSFRELTYGKSDVVYSGGDIMDFVKRYEVAHGLDVEEDNVVGGDLEESVGGASKVVRNRYDVDKGCWVYEEISDDDYVEVAIDDDGNVHEAGSEYFEKMRGQDNGYTNGAGDDKAVDKRYSFDKAEDADYVEGSIDDDDVYEVGDSVGSKKDIDVKDSRGRRRYFANDESKAKKRGRESKLEESVKGIVGAKIEDETFYGNSPDDEAGGEMSLEEISKYEAEVVDEISKVYEDVRREKEARAEGRKYILKGMEMATKLLTGDVEGGRHVSDPVDRESRFYDAEEEAHGWASRYRSIAESAVYDVMNVDFDFDFDSKFNTGWKEFESIGKRVKGQRGAFNGKMDDLDSEILTFDKVNEIIERGYVSTLGVPVIYSEGEAKLPSKKRDFTRDEIKRLVDGIEVCD